MYSHFIRLGVFTTVSLLSTSAFAMPLTLIDSDTLSVAGGIRASGSVDGAQSDSFTSDAVIGGEIDYIGSFAAPTNVNGSSRLDQNAIQWNFVFGPDLRTRQPYTASAFIQLDGLDDSGARAVGGAGTGLDLDLAAAGSSLLFNGVTAAQKNSTGLLKTNFFVALVDADGEEAVVIETIPELLFNDVSRTFERFDIGFGLGDFEAINASLNLNAIDVIEFGFRDVTVSEDNTFSTNISFAGNFGSVGDPFVSTGNGTGTGGTTGGGNGGNGGSTDPVAVTEPSTTLLFGFGLLGAAGIARRKRQ